MINTKKMFWALVHNYLSLVKQTESIILSQALGADEVQ